MNILKDKDKRKGLIGTILFHALLFLAFIFLGLTYIEPPEEEGIVVNFGDSQTGLGEEEPAPSNNPVEEQEQVTPSNSQSSSTQKSKEEALTQEEIATLSVEAKRKKEEKERKAVEEKNRLEEQRRIAEENKRKEEEARRKKAESDKLFSGSFGKNNGNSNSQGVNGVPGNQGDPNGTPGADNYGPGGPGGDGKIGFSLSGRKMVQKPIINETSQDQGKVVVKIIVDKYGKVTKATAGEKGTTATSSYLKKISEEAALKTKFDANPNAAEEQVGTMTFTFKLE